MNTVRQALHQLVDALMDQVDGTVIIVPTEKAKPEPDNLPGPSKQVIRVGRANLSSKEQGKEAVPAAEKRDGRSGRAATDVRMAVTSAGPNWQLVVTLPAAVAQAARFKVGGRVRATPEVRQLRVVSDLKGVKLYRQSSGVEVKIGGGHLGLRAKQHSTHCSSAPLPGGGLVIDMPDWWPKGAVVVSRPQVRSKKKNGTPTPIPGGELIEPEDREFHCHTCQEAIATVQCPRCEGLYCAGCWRSHELTHRRAGEHQEHEKVLVHV